MSYFSQRNRCNMLWFIHSVPKSMTNIFGSLKSIWTFWRHVLSPMHLSGKSTKTHGRRIYVNLFYIIGDIPPSNRRRSLIFWILSFIVCIVLSSACDLSIFTSVFLDLPLLLNKFDLIFLNLKIEKPGQRLRMLINWKIVTCFKHIAKQFGKIEK